MKQTKVVSFLVSVTLKVSFCVFCCCLFCFVAAVRSVPVMQRNSRFAPPRGLRIKEPRGRGPARVTAADKLRFYTNDRGPETQVLPPSFILAPLRRFHPRLWEWELDWGNEGREADTHRYIFILPRNLPLQTYTHTHTPTQKEVNSVRDDLSSQISTNNSGKCSVSDSKTAASTLFYFYDHRDTLKNPDFLCNKAAFCKIVKIAKWFCWIVTTFWVKFSLSLKRRLLWTTWASVRDEPSFTGTSRSLSVWVLFDVGSLQPL